MSFNIQFANLEPHVQDKFIAVASKDPEGRSAAEWFEHLVPESLQDSSYETEVFMDGGTVTKEVFVHDPGASGGYWDTVEHTIPDRDISRIEPGVEGGEYTHDNTIMEDSSINRARGGETMTETEYVEAVEANSVDAELIDGASSAVDTLVSTSAESSDILATASEALSDLIAPVIATVVVSKHVASQFDEPKDKLAWGSLAGGLGALAATTPPGQFLLGCYGIYAVGKLGFKATLYAMKHA